jgi:cell division protein FtsI (penicillin-binding protein 3)
VTERLSNRRIRLLLGLFVLVFAGTIARAVWIQGVQASRFEGMAARQHEGTTLIPAARGTIFDRTGEPLAIGEQATTVYADPREVKDPRRVALAAARVLGVDAEKLYPALADRSKHFVYVLRKADPAKAAELEKLNLPGLGFYAEELRYYPQRSVAAHVLGYAGLDNKGLEGLERSLDRSLVGKPGSQTTIRDPAGRVIDVIATKPERAGEDVFLTIDHRIQANAETRSAPARTSS